MVDLFKPVSSDTLTSVFSASTAFTTEKYRIVIHSVTIAILRAFSKLNEYMTPLKYQKNAIKWKSQTITLAQFPFLVIATSSRNKEQWRTGSVSALPSSAKPCQNGAAGNMPWCVLSQPRLVHNLVLRISTLMATFPTNALGPSDLPWYFGHSHPLLSTSELCQ